MSKNKGASPLVYSTDPNFRLAGEDNMSKEETQDPALQKLRVMLDKKHRAGKEVTLVTGFQGKDEDLERLGKLLKTTCGCGGSIKNGEVIVQGDNRDKIMAWLLNNGYKLAKKI
ncbi:MAG: translation initiation factor [Ginsengibacter sp.]